MNYTTTWTLNLSDKISNPLNNVSEKLENATKKATKFGDCLKKLKPIDWQAVELSISKISEKFNSVVETGENYEKALLDVSAITGVTGEELDKLGDKARGLAKDFGTTASDNLGLFQTILSRLGPQIGENQEALSNMGKYANTLSKTMGGDVVGATDALTTSMLQFKVNLNDPIEAASEMERMMNVMAAGAQEGASEVVQTSQALVQAGGMAKLANVSFEETNSALQALAQGGKYGAEAGVGLRNVLIKMNAPSAISKQATELLASYGVNMKKVADASTPFAERLKELQKIGQNTDALAAVFGAENVQSAQTLINSAQWQEELTEKITGTNVAYEQAGIVMNGWSERMQRAKALIEDLKIGAFSFTSVASVGFNVLSGGLSVFADFSTISTGLIPVLKSTAIWFKATAVGQQLASLWAGIMTAKQWLLNAAMSANPIGIIIAAIGALIVIGAVLVSKVGGWGKAWQHTWNGAKLLFQGFVMGIQLYWNTAINGLMIGLNKIKEGWYKFKNAVGIGNEGENNSALTQIKADTEARKKAIVDGAKQLITVSKKAGNEFQKAGQSLYIKDDKKDKKVKKGGNSTETPTIVDVNTFLGGGGTIDNKGSKKDKKGKGDKKGGSSGSSDGLSMGGSKGNRTMNVAVTINNHFSGNSRNNAADRIVGQITDRLRDGLVALD